MQMTVFQLILVVVMVEASAMGCLLVMRGRPTPLKIAIIVLCLFSMVGAFAVGSYWNHDDLTCHPGQHCFPWGD